MSSIHNLLNQCLLEDSLNLYRVYKDKEGLLILADNARAFAGGRQYREAAISAFVARQIATAGNREIWALSDLSHPVTIQWYDRLSDLWPD
ncbi:hypothetical protein N8T08_004959 [Aspergillus melleus]|uniref:Uncharacterized protein n=1 Tax=Aspergillus melleus TaxID=138277 RepID=A0ACC3B2Z2_9EURO|nr:hypothetical protein N8T08_004959 [Aspergillus melleus]